MAETTPPRTVDQLLAAALEKERADEARKAAAKKKRSEKAKAKRAAAREEKSAAKAAAATARAPKRGAAEAVVRRSTAESQQAVIRSLKFNDEEEKVAREVMSRYLAVDGPVMSALAYVEQQTAPQPDAHNPREIFLKILRDFIRGETADRRTDREKLLGKKTRLEREPFYSRDFKNTWTAYAYRAASIAYRPAILAERQKHPELQAGVSLATFYVLLHHITTRNLPPIDGVWAALYDHYSFYGLDYARVMGNIKAYAEDVTEMTAQAFFTKDLLPDIKDTGPLKGQIKALAAEIIAADAMQYEILPQKPPYQAAGYECRALLYAVYYCVGKTLQSAEKAEEVVTPAARRAAYYDAFFVNTRDKLPGSEGRFDAHAKAALETYAQDGFDEQPLQTMFGKFSVYAREYLPHIGGDDVKGYTFAKHPARWRWVREAVGEYLKGLKSKKFVNVDLEPHTRAERYFDRGAAQGAGRGDELRAVWDHLQMHATMPCDPVFFYDDIFSANRNTIVKLPSLRGFLRAVFDVPERSETRAVVAETPQMEDVLQNLAVHTTIRLWAGERPAGELRAYFMAAPITEGIWESAVDCINSTAVAYGTFALRAYLNLTWRKYHIPFTMYWLYAYMYALRYAIERRPGGAPEQRAHMIAMFAGGASDIPRNTTDAEKQTYRNSQLRIERFVSESARWDNPTHVSDERVNYAIYRRHFKAKTSYALLPATGTLKTTLDLPLSQPASSTPLRTRWINEIAWIKGEMGDLLQTLQRVAPTADENTVQARNEIGKVLDEKPEEEREEESEEEPEEESEEELDEELEQAFAREFAEPPEQPGAAAAAPE